MTRLIIASLAAALGIGAAVWHAPAWGQESCQPYDAAFRWLEGLFGERVIDTMLGDGAFLQFWGNSTTGSWTILHVDYDAMACLVSSGGGWDGRVSLLGRES